MTVATGLPALVAFDLDDTLAPSKSRVDPAMAGLLDDLLAVTQVCIISGGRFEQFEAQVLSALPQTERLSRLHVMPTCGTRYYRWQAPSWQLVYARDLTDEQKAEITTVLADSAKQLGLWCADPWGPIIEDRGSQITFSALGQQAPVSAKAAWDPDGAKKESLRALAAPLLPDLEVRGGGSTSIDVTLKGVDKGYGMRELCKVTGLELDDFVFVGDRLDPGGNDYPVKLLGVRCIPVENWHETIAIIEGLLTAAGALGSRP